jgi:hypothetical protein
MSLAAATRQILLIRLSRSNLCRPKRLKPKQQSRALGPQYVGSKKFYRSAAGAVRKINPGHSAPIARGDELEMNL